MKNGKRERKTNRTCYRCGKKISKAKRLCKICLEKNKIECWKRVNKLMKSPLNHSNYVCGKRDPIND